MDFTLSRLATLLLWSIALSLAARAHGPADITSRMTVHPAHIELAATIGVDAARQLFTTAGLAPEHVTKSLRALGPDSVVPQPRAIADRLFQLRHATETLVPRSVVSRAEGMEVVLIIHYPRPADGKLTTNVTGYAHLPELRPGSLMIFAEPNATLGGALLNRENPELTVSLAAPVQTVSPNK